MQPSRALRRVAVLGILAAVLLAPAAGGLATSAAATPPPPPAAYYGSLTVNGDPAPAGITIVAKIDGEVRGRLTTSQDGGYGGPGAFDAKLQVDGTDADDGKTVRFVVGGVQAPTTVDWHSADVQQVDLAVTGNVTLPGDDDSGDTGTSDGGGGRGGGGGGGGGGGASQPADDGEPDVYVQAGENGSTRVQVEDASAGQPVEVDVPGGDDQNVTVDGLTVTTSRNTSFTLEVSASEDPPADAPELNDSDGAVGYLRVDHDVPDDDVSEVTFTFQVSTDRLEERGIQPADVVLYRYHDGSWQTLQTTPVRQTATHHVFEAVSPGLSVFAIGVRENPDATDDGGGDSEPDASADLAVADARLSADEVAVGDDVTVTATVENRGDADGETAVSLVVGGETAGEKTVAVPAGDARQVTFTYRADDGGEFDVRVGNATAGRLVVTADDAGTTNGSTGGEGGEESGGPLGGSLVVVLVVALVGALAVLAYYRRFRT